MTSKSFVWVGRLSARVWGLLGGLALASLFLAIIFERYPQYPGFRGIRFVAYSVLLSVACLIVFLDSRVQTKEQAVDRHSGVWVGIFTGLVWVLEISFNNFVTSRVSTAGTRFYVDNGAWGLIMLAILAGAVRRTLQSRRIGSGVRFGLWSGSTSGLIACLVGLLLVVAWMPYLLRDPVNIAEYASRGSTDGVGMAGYFAYETLAGALGHLLVLGLLLGLLLGGLGGVLTRGIHGLWLRRRLILPTALSEPDR